MSNERDFVEYPCQRCGKSSSLRLPYVPKFCTRCGAKLETIAGQEVGWICPRCRACVSPRREVCPICTKQHKASRSTTSTQKSII